MNKLIVAALCAACLHACAAVVAPGDDWPDVAGIEQDAASGAAPDGPDARGACSDLTVLFEGRCCWVARPGVCDAATCEALVPEYAGRTTCANPQLCCAAP